MTCHMKNALTFYCLSVLMIFGCLYTIYTVDNMYQSYTIISRTSKTGKWPVIRSWTTHFRDSLNDLLEHSYRKTKCEYKCRFVERKNKNYTNTDAYIFHSRNINSNDLPTKRTRDQLFILFGLESAYHFGYAYSELPPNYFNATSTYRMDSDYPFPYFSYIRLKENEKPMWNQSEGACFDSEIENCPRDNSDVCRSEFLSKFKFYLASENSVCQDYVTEKFSYQSQMLIPIVLKRSVVERIVPKNEKMFIAADDFESPEKLAEYLRFLENNDDEYLKYFDWVKRYRLVIHNGINAMCKLCEDLYRLRENQFEERILKDAKKFVVGDGKCYDDFSETLLN